MAASGLLALLDDITTILDDVAAMSKVAAQKTAGIAGDDLAVNAEGLVGLDPSRELPIVGQVALGSVLNKLVLVPLALVLPSVVITPMLMGGGAFLCYEGVHKVAEKLFHHPDAVDEQHHAQLVKAVLAGPDALRKMEAGKVRQAILTDVVLSAEIVAVALGTVADEPFVVKATTLALVSLGMTVVIYGLVAGLVKLDDLGLHLKGDGVGFRARLGQALIAGTPMLMRGVSVVGTAAMFMVGGGILMHGLHLDERLHSWVEGLGDAPLGWGLETAAAPVMGVAVGALALAVVEGVKAVVRRLRGTAA